MHRLILSSLVATFLWIGVAYQASGQGLIRDAEIEKSLREWTDPILEVAGLQPNDVGLYIINDNSLNAFVANGQRIHLHAGLLMAADNARQIKGVIAHETCHIACGHTVTRTRAARVASRPALVSIGLGVLAIAAGAGEAGAALIASSQQFAALNFFVHTRAEEAMADTQAIQYLSDLGQSPMGIVEFFEKFRYQEVLSEARRFPYFRSHPLSSERVRVTRTLALETGLADVPEDPEVVYQFDMMQAKLVGFLEPPARVYRDYPPTDTSQPALYARSISAMQVSDIGTALRDVEELLLLDTENPYFHELKGQILFEAGRAPESVEPLLRANELLPDNALLLISMARSLIARGEEGDVEAGEFALRDALIAEPNNAFAWAQLAIALEKQGLRPEAQLATAESAYNVGDYPRAYSFASRAVRDLTPGTPDARRAADVRNATDPALPENEPYYRRRR
ncbi:MAG: M48 family metalloprotease [Henriciella sp.]|jgi:predicted Zn-dependent protease|nr:M48 family metalloprotease [Henriciella sp.]